jgi:hypothetical protein
MPLYEYECQRCGNVVEVLRPINGAIPPLCDAGRLSANGGDLGICDGGAMIKVPSVCNPHDTMMLHHQGGTKEWRIPRAGGKGTKIQVSGGRY